jgi:hypothetical protein
MSGCTFLHPGENGELRPARHWLPCAHLHVPTRDKVVVAIYGVRFEVVRGGRACGVGGGGRLKGFVRLAGPGTRIDASVGAGVFLLCLSPWSPCRLQEASQKVVADAEAARAVLAAQAAKNAAAEGEVDQMAAAQVEAAQRVVSCAKGLRVREEEKSAASELSALAATHPTPPHPIVFHSVGCLWVGCMCADPSTGPASWCGLDRPGAAALPEDPV